MPFTPDPAGLLHAHIDNTPLGVIEWDSEWRVVHWGGRAEAIFGWSAEEVLGKRPDEWRFVHEDDAMRIVGVMSGLSSGKMARNIECNRNYTKDGSIKHCQWHNSILSDSDGNYRSCLSLVLDVTETVRVTDDLARSESRLRMALRSAGMLGWEACYQKRIFISSEDIFHYYGFSQTYNDYSQLNDVVHADDQPAMMAAISQAFQTDGEFHITFRGGMPAPDGTERWFEARAQIVRDHDGVQYMAGVTADITQRKRDAEQREHLQRVLLETQKYESLGLLAGGVAHDFNNLLTVMVGNSALARMTIPVGNAAHERLAQIEAACQRATLVCRQMLAYAGRTQVAPQHLDLNMLVRESRELLASAAGRRSKIEIVESPGLPRVFAEMQSMQQVLLNLVSNAGESHGETSGTVSIRLGRETLLASDANTTPVLSAGDYIALDVQDHGCGMDESVKAKMFDPFFSTKFTGRGLGLAATLGIVRAHEGGLRVTSTPGAGTTVRLLIPIK